MASNKLAVLTAVERRLASIRTVDEAKSIRDQAEAIRVYAKSARKGLEIQNHAAYVKIQAERRAGALLPKGTGGGRGRKNPFSLKEILGTDTDGGAAAIAHRWQAMATVPEGKVRELAARATDMREELTSTAVYAIATGATGRLPRTFYNSGDFEWYTPPAYLTAAREVLGAIDLDPASTPEANAVVGAATFYTADEDGLSRPWRGRVWLNPPYATELIGRFINKLLESYGAGDVIAAITLTNNATETAWFVAASQQAAALCHPRGRVRFWHPRKDSSGPLQGQSLHYFGERQHEFTEVFSAFGPTWVRP